MTGFNVVTEEQLRPVLDLILGQSWPIPETETPRIIEDLGWTPHGRWSARTTLPVSLNIATFGGIGDEVASIMFRVSDTLPDESEEGSRVISAAFPRAADTISSYLGFQPTRPRPWGLPGLTWDMPDGRQVNLSQGMKAILLEIWSSRNADIERGQIRYGVDPTRDLDDAE